MKDSSRDSWRTPWMVFEWAQHLVGPFDFDAACDQENQLALPLWLSAPAFSSGDSLSAAWPKDCRIWCNPPYSNIDPWIDRALACNSLVAMLIMSPNGEDRFARLIPRAHEIQIVGRIAFIDGSGKPAASNTRGSSLFLINPRYGAGQRTFVRREEIFERKVA